MSSVPISVGILDDHPLIIQGISALFSGVQEVVFWGGYTLLSDFQQALVHSQPQVLLLDVQLGNNTDGITVATSLRRSHPHVNIIALTSNDQPTVVRAMLQQGVKGFLLKNAGKQEILEAISSVMRGEEYLHNEVKEVLLQSALERPTTSSRQSLLKLTRREKEVLQLIIREYTTSEIARELFITESTVETHRNNLLHKLGVRNVAGLVKIALECDLLK